MSSDECVCRIRRSRPAGKTAKTAIDGKKCNRPTSTTSAVAAAPSSAPSSGVTSSRMQSEGAGRGSKYVIPQRER